MAFVVILTAIDANRNFNSHIFSMHSLQKVRLECDWDATVHQTGRAKERGQMPSISGMTCHASNHMLTSLADCNMAFRMLLKSMDDLHGSRRWP